jgi:hypothetical protein
MLVPLSTDQLQVPSAVIAESSSEKPIKPKTVLAGRFKVQGRTINMRNEQTNSSPLKSSATILLPLELPARPDLKRISPLELLYKNPSVMIEHT